MALVATLQARDYFRQKNIVPIAATLVWEDGFDGLEINSQNWQTLVGDGTVYNYSSPGWASDELATATADNVQVVNGNLVIEARSAQNGRDLTSGKLTSVHLQSLTPPLALEARVKLPHGGAGLWPVITLLPEPLKKSCIAGCDGVYGPAPASGEVTLLSTVDMRTVYGGIQFGSLLQPKQQLVPWKLPAVRVFDQQRKPEDFHAYRIEWELQRMRWYVDGVLYAAMDCACAGSADPSNCNKQQGGWFSANPLAFSGQSACAPFDQKFFMQLELRVGGPCAGYPENTVFPQQLLVDYIRVYNITNRPHLPAAHYAAADEWIAIHSVVNGTSSNSTSVTQPSVSAPSLGPA